MSSLMLIFISWKSGYTMRRVGATGLWNRLIQLFYQTFPWDVLQEKFTETIRLVQHEGFFAKTS